MRSRFNWMRLICRLLAKVVVGCVVMMCTVVYAERLTQVQYDQKIQQYIDVVNQTKQVLDDPTASASGQLQQQALCLRIQTYKAILKLSQDHIGLDFASMMKIVAQSFLDQQKQSFNTSAMSEQIFCANTTLKNG